MVRRMAVSRTAQYVALYRALESVGPRPRLRDPFAARFLSPSLARAVRVARLPPLGALLTGYADLRAPGARTSAIARTLYIEARDHCDAVGDYPSKMLFEELIQDEEGHIDFLETQIHLFETIGAQNYGQLNAKSADEAE